MIILKISATNTHGSVTWVNRCHVICAPLSP